MSALSQYPVRVREFSSVAEMQEHYKRLRAATFKPVPNAPRERVEFVRPLPTLVPVKEPVAYVKPTVPDMSWFWCPSMPAKRIMRALAMQAGFTFDDLVGEARTFPLVTVRQQAMVTLAIAKPEMSVSSIAKLFKRDHTTVLAAFRKLGFDRGNVRPPARTGIVTDEDIIAAFYSFGSINKVELYLNIGRRQVKSAFSRMEAAGKFNEEQARRPRARAQMKRLRAVYDAYREVGTIYGAVKKMQCSKKTVVKSIETFGGKCYAPSDV